MIQGNMLDSTIVSGFCNWKDGTRCFSKHESRNAHMASSNLVITTPGTISDVGYLLPSEHALQIASN